jgi:hypothetical protein
MPVMERTTTNGRMTNAGEMVENLGKNWRMAMKVKNLEGDRE